MNNTRLLLFAFAVSALSGCEAEIDAYTPQPGEADFSVFVALGNSLTAGYTDGELYMEGQQNSFPNILAGQLSHVGLSEFRQPLMKDHLGFGNRLILAEIQGSLTPVPAAGNPDPGNFQSIANQGPFHNMGVPGAKTQHLLIPGYGRVNPYFQRFAKDPGQSSILSDALETDPSFFSLWTGNNDILGYAISGGVGDVISPADEFAAHTQSILQQLTARGAKGVVSNLADISKAPFFRTIPYNALVLTDPDVINLLNLIYEKAPHIRFEPGLNAFVVADASHQAGVRQLEDGESVLLSLPLDSIAAAGWGSQVPIPEQFYLSLSQIASITEAVRQYNQRIRLLAEEFGLAYVDIHSRLEEAGEVIYFDAVAFTTDFISGGLFSLDGIHLSKRGNAIVANEFISAINQHYNASIPKVIIARFDGILFP